MKRKSVLVLALCLLCLLLVLSACGKTTETETETPVYKMDLTAWQGVYSEEIAHRGVLTLVATGEEEAAITVDWPGSAADTAVWEMRGSYDAETQSIVYTNGKLTEKTFDANGGETDQVVYTDGSGSFLLTYGKLVWTDAMGGAGDGSTFGFDMSLAEYIRSQHAKPQAQTPAPIEGTGTPTTPETSETPAEQPIAQPEPTPEVNAKDLPIIRKSPTDETVKVGGSAVFVAKYDNALWAVWHFVSPDGMIDLDYEQAADRFPTLEIVNGMYSRLTLNKIPLELNGWRVYCRYSNPKGYTDTGTALITVTDPNATAPAAP